MTLRRPIGNGAAEPAGNFCHRQLSPQSCLASLILTADKAPRDPGALLRRYDTFPPFANLKHDDERERKAATQRPGTFFVVATPPAFASLPEYSRWQGSQPPSITRQPSLSLRSGSSPWIRDPGHPLQPQRCPDPNVTFISRFEDPVTLALTPLGTHELQPSPQNLALQRETIPRPHPRLPIAIPIQATQAPAFLPGLLSAPSQHFPSRQYGPVNVSALSAPPAWPRSSYPPSAGTTQSSHSSGARNFSGPSRMSSRSGSLLEEMVGIKGSWDDYEEEPG